MIRILIADDHMVIRKGLKQILLEEYPSAIIEEANDAEEVISKTITVPIVALSAICSCQAAVAWTLCFI